MTKDEKQVYDILQESLYFKNRHYEVCMLWNNPNIYLRNNIVLAVHRFESLEKRLIKNPDKAKQYSDTIKKDVELGHVTKLSTTESTSTKNT